LKKREKKKKKKKKEKMSWTHQGPSIKKSIYIKYINIAMFLNNFKSERDHKKRRVFHTSSIDHPHVHTHAHLDLIV
jgi:hypothetical protein